MRRDRQSGLMGQLNQQVLHVWIRDSGRRVRNRPDRRGQEASPESDHYEHQHGMACDHAEESRHCCILALPSPVSQSWASIRRCWMPTGAASQ
jgi:hypothetical protein